jgi:hypothetical protein
MAALSCLRAAAAFVTMERDLSGVVDYSSRIRTFPNMQIPGNRERFYPQTLWISR